MGNFQSVKKYLPIALISALILVFILLTFSLKAIFPGKKSSISGVFIYTGTMPLNSSITLLAKEVQSGSPFITIATNITPESLTPWQDINVTNGKSYEIKAELISQGKIISTSNTITAFAPTLNEELSFNLSNSQTNVQISITASPITQQTITSFPSSQPVASSIIKPSPSVALTPSLSPIVPASPSSSTQFASMSGTIQFTGQAPLNSRIVVFQRVTGTQNYQVAEDNVTPVNGAVWSWSKALAGTTYDLIAILKQKQNNGLDTDIADSNVLTLATIGGNFAINSNTSLSIPSPNISVNCNNLDGTSLNWSASILFQTITGAQSYWYEIGTTNGGTDLTNVTANATSGSNQTLSEPFKNGTTYYARYAYSAVPNLLGNDPQFSSLSSTVQLKCSQ